ncbi:tripartite tricarboxylate transporter substrate-binding protein [Roseomonas harenae]|uniref:tripartite tricarboxylate transporter substrate-binding protein n=1 Tax=Muricoccus harenae TaxID=2692566 RepID=UPI002E2E5F48|nr:tripartite tricarboxylate transporter substrate-binding protein [Roseomonas harenae]
MVDNRPGASGKLGTKLLLRATPDGYMLLMAWTGASMTVAGKDKPFSMRQELAPITLAAAPAYLAVSHPYCHQRASRHRYFPGKYSRTLPEAG